MCIRDRNYVVELIPVGKDIFYYQEDFGMEIKFIQPDANTCLLYTSDAADERSSVDLGGRRIINNINTNTGCSWRCVKKRIIKNNNLCDISNKNRKNKKIM